VNHEHGGSAPARRTGRSPLRVAFGVFAGSALVFLILEHRAHLLGAWPLLFLFFCVGAHFLMHRGHSGGGGHGH
jgi:hypothetical protein